MYGYFIFCPVYRVINIFVTWSNILISSKPDGYYHWFFLVFFTVEYCWIFLLLVILTFWKHKEKLICLDLWIFQTLVLLKPKIKLYSIWRGKKQPKYLSGSTQQGLCQMMHILAYFSKTTVLITIWCLTCKEFVLKMWKSLSFLAVDRHINQTD